MQWVNAGLGMSVFYLSREVREAWIATRSIALANAMHCPGKLEDASVIGEFLDDRDFMIKVLERHPHLYEYTTGEARSDPWLCVVSLAGSAEFAKEYLLDLHMDGHDDLIDSICFYLRSRLSVFDTFSKFILGNMLSTQSIEETGSSLTMLWKRHLRSKRV
jgi:hypothetical protein